MSTVLVLGLSGQVGSALLPGLLARFGAVDAVTRGARDPVPGVRWILGSLEAMPAPASAGHEFIVSLGPLDCFAEWFDVADPGAARVIALGSTGVHDKRQSPDPAERALAARLAAAESRLFEAGRRQGAAVTVLRPTLLYGSGRDRSLTPLLRVARRWRCLPLPANAGGLRQPVHVDDVAAAVLACLEAPATTGRAYDLPGGETLSFDAMVRRFIQHHAPGTWMPRIPAWSLSLAAALARWTGRGGPGSGSFARLAQDQHADVEPARSGFGYDPRPFRP